MEIAYVQKGNGMYCLSREAIEQISSTVLKEYSPTNLASPTALDADDFLIDYLGLLVRNRYIGTIDSGILGLIVMGNETEIPSTDTLFRPTVYKECRGTVYISPTLSKKENHPRMRYTQIHEGAHWLLHDAYFEKLAAKKPRKRSIACRSIERYRSQRRTETDWLEWQADALAAALLMPKDVFFDWTQMVLRHAGATKGYLEEGVEQDRQVFYDTIDKIRGPFCVSRRAAQIRMIHLGIVLPQF